MRRSCIGVAAALFGATVLSACDGGSRPATERDFSPKHFSGASVRIDNTWFPLRPGTQFAWVRIGAHLPPGTYEVVCIYHAYLGMLGRFTVSAANSGSP